MVLFCCLLPWFISIIIIGTFIIVLLLSYWENKAHIIAKNSEWCCSGAQSCPILCDSMNCSTPGFPVLHYLQEFIQTLVHWGGEAIQSFHPLLPPCLLTLYLAQPQGFFQWVDSSHQVAEVFGASALASVLPMNILGFLPLEFTGLISLLSKGRRVFSSTTVWKHQFFSTEPSLWSNSHIHTWLLQQP